MMEMSAQSTSFTLPQNFEEAPEKPQRKICPQQETGVSFPSLLERKREPETKDDLVAKVKVCSGSDTPCRASDSHPSQKGHLGLASANETLTPTKPEVSPVPISNIAGFLQSLALVDSKEAGSSEPDLPGQELVQPAPTIAAADAPMISEKTGQTVDLKISAADLVATKPQITPLTTDVTLAKKHLADDAGQSLISKSESYPTVAIPELGQAIAGTENLAAVAPKVTPKTTPNTHFGKTPSSTAGPEKPAGVNPTTENLVAAKSDGPIKDAVLASNKAPADTYNIPEKLVREIADAGQLKAPAQAEAAENSPTTGDNQPLDLTSAQPMENLSSTGSVVEVSLAPNEVSAMSEISSATENFTPNQEIKPSSIQTSSGQTAVPVTTTLAESIRQQVLQHIATRSEGPVVGEKITLMLNPESLGQVEVQLVAKGDTLTVIIAAQEGQVEKAIQDSIRDLTDALLARGGKFQQVEVKVETKNTQQERQQQRQENDKDQATKDNQGSPQERQNQSEPQQTAWFGDTQEG